MSLKPGQKRNVLSMVHQIEELKEQAKACYERMDELTEKIGKLLPPGEEVDYPRLQKTVRMVDNFEDRNVVFRPAAVRRFEIKVEDY